MTDKNKYNIPLSEISGCAGRIIKYETEVDKIAYDSNKSVGMKIQADLDEAIRFLNNITEMGKGKLLLMFDMELIKSLVKIIDYMYHDEEKDYSECLESGCDVESHIFLSVKKVSDFLHQIEDEIEMEEVWKYVKSHIS